MDGRRRALWGASRLGAAILCLIAIAGIALAQDDDVIEFSGNSSTTTPAFEVQGPWILDWRIFSDFPQSLSVDIALLDGVSGMHEGQVLQTKEMGNGVKLFNESGSYRLRIDSNLARWQILISELTEEEAERYTPIGSGQRQDSPFRQRNRR